MSQPRKTSAAVARKSELISHLLKAIAHPARLKILCGLMEGEKPAGDLTRYCGASQSATSQFLARMKQDGLLQSRREHNFIYYSIADERLAGLLSAIQEIYC